MSYAWKGIRDWEEHKRECRISQTTHLSGNLYERMRAHIVRIVREHVGNITLAAEELGCSESTVRRYMKFVPFEHLMRNPLRENQFDWRSMEWRRWRRLLLKHPQFADRMPVAFLRRKLIVAEVLAAHPETISLFDPAQLNDSPSFFVKLLIRRPMFERYCDFSIFEDYDVKELLRGAPQFFERVKIETLLPYHWKEIIDRHPDILQKMEAKSHREWPFNFKVYYLRNHPDFESEFHEWDKIDWVDLEDIQREQPELYARHYDKPPKAYEKHEEEDSE